jgi:ribosomal protein S14
MKKLLEKDKKRRKRVVLKEQEHFVLKSIIKNLNFFSLIRWNAHLKLNITQNSSKTALTPRCLRTVNKKRFNKLTGFSRHIFLKEIRFGRISGIKKSSW